MQETTSSERDGDGQLNYNNVTNLINVNTFNLILKQLLQIGDAERVEKVLDAKREVMEQLTQHQICMAQGRDTPSQKLAKQGKEHWTDEQVNGWIKLIQSQTIQQLKQEEEEKLKHHHHHHQQQHKQQQPIVGYKNHTTNTVTIAKDGTHPLGDIFFNTEKGGGYLYPCCAGKYYEPVDPITFHEMDQLVKEVKHILQKQMLTHTNKQQLTPNMTNSINEIDINNVVGFLLQDSIGDCIETLKGMPQPWLYLKSISSFNNYGHYALVWLPTPEDFCSNQWPSQQSKFPPITPDSATIQAVLKRFKNSKHKGFAFPDEKNTYHFLSSKAYRRFFTLEPWDWKEKNECFLKWDGGNSKLIQQKPGKKGEYKFLQLPQVELSLLKVFSIVKNVFTFVVFI